MYGPGIAPPQPPPARRGTVIGLRVLFAVLPVVTLGTGAWGSVLRLAVVLRRPLDWVLVPLVALIGISGFVMVGTARDERSWQSNLGTSLVLLCMVATPTYFLIMDIRGTRRQSQPAPLPVPPHLYPYGYVPGPIPGAAPGNGPGISVPPPYGYPQQPPVPPPPTGPRIDQVKAELDELSDYLRKEEGR
ncbi:hypothetical protein [Actinacidiphila acididurans]|uniref:Integral membrane protein n=1 Tax=Actinacidiphila acididurans TaxID=2784346 RepID=A0ABS2TNS6_9ACTN|nr:hypothetical protein [Actinacidiphila acididurans]MBM9504992.1 hypothetical protein [Actinacidiphila acididurans]